ncbi:hypothetical protein Dsin_001005 [Dipteronia sinensis]|uniref:RRM domain-containing protein n=1 Tax=Dipteronia sinensis TaxID=43782 RepID=A0AAE0B4J2_9ROSI|nr:hypothetical protein Dsin_001005 [Dipteronia sinensis]
MKRTTVSPNWASAFKCKQASLPISYLGFPLGGRPSSKEFWNPVVSKIKNRLAPWKRKFLSKGGRLVLIKSAISSIPTYFLSVFKLHFGVAKMIEKLQMDFLWGDGAHKRKLHAVNWGEVCNRKAKGGLGIGRILDKNKALLVKWIWRFEKEDQSLWRRVICSKYKVDEISLYWNWHESKFTFVKSIETLLKVGSQTCRMIKEGFQTVVGSGNRADLWSDIFCDGRPLNVAFPRCFALAVKKSGVVQDFGNLVGERWDWNIVTRRPCFDWEKDQWRCFLLFLGCIPIRRHIRDTVAWSLTPTGRYRNVDAYAQGGGKDFRESLFSIFIGNLNPIVDMAGLWGMFKPFGNEWDVFLSSKKNYRRRCYAFIRFETLEEACKVASKVDGMHIYRWPISAKVAEYDWSRRRSPSFRPSRKAYFHNGRSRAEEDWLSRSALGVLNEFSNVGQVNQKLEARGFVFSSSFLGEKSIV